MSGQTGIEWCDATWSVVSGCTKKSEGCRNCWACRLAATRLRNHPRYRGLATYPDLRGVQPEWTGEVRTHPDLLDQPLHWRKSKRIFVCSQADLFHENVTKEFLWAVFRTMWYVKRHTFLVLTKRSARMAEYLNKLGFQEIARNDGLPWPIPNVWLGVSVEDQKTADERIPLLLQTPAAVRFVSYEPALGLVDLRHYLGPLRMTLSPGTGVEHGLDWIIAGGESGPNARPSHPDWFRKVRDDCQLVGTPFFFKQWGEWGPKSHLGYVKGANWGTIAHDGQFFETATPWNGHDDDGGGEAMMERVGKKAAGRWLDGQTWDEFPEAR